MAGRTLTAANSVLLLSITDLYDTGRQIQGFSADNVFDTDNVNPAETVMGVDGILSGGWVPVPIVQNITLQADSLSIDIFERWYDAQQTIRESYIAAMTVVLPGLQKQYNCEQGFLTGWPPLPSMGRIAQPRRATITWGRITSAPYGA